MSFITPGDIRNAVKEKRDDILEWLKVFIRFPSEKRPPDGFEGEA